MREIHNRNNQQAAAGYTSLLMLVDTLANKGQNVASFLPEYEPPRKADDEEKQSEFIKGEWWKQ